MITLDRLRYFIEVATQEHVGKSAKVLAVSPSVVSSAIRELELELSCELFIREKQRLKLNEKGRVLLEKAQEVINSVELLPDILFSGPLELKGHFKLGARHFLMHKYLIPAFLKVKKNHPKLTVEFISLDSGLAVSQTLSGNLDAALVFRSSYTHKVEETLLSTGQFKLVVRHNHPILKKKKSELVEELNRLPAITFRTSFGANFWENHPAFGSIGLKPNHTFFYEDTQSALQLLSSTDGWAFMPDQTILGNKSVSELSINKDIAAPVNISLVRNSNRASNQLLGLLEEVLKEKI
ncbi:MAG: LysR family transcriptional regulator [Bdellovibrionales bacterium]|nr:LysR family transcriptional regulator [Bdellovibrionales bacterium]